MLHERFVADEQPLFIYFTFIAFAPHQNGYIECFQKIQKFCYRPLLHSGLLLEYNNPFLTEIICFEQTITIYYIRFLSLQL